MSVRDIQSLPPTERWQELSKTCSRDLALKKIGLALVIIINIGIIGAGLWGIIQYADLPADAFIASPYIAGALWGLVDLGLPTLGLDSMTIRQYSNPAMVISKGISYLFFGPTKLVINACDWRDYSNPALAKAIVLDLKNESFREIHEKYGDSFGSLAKYGIISKDDYEAIAPINGKYRKAKQIQDYYVHASEQVVQDSRKDERLIPKKTKEALLRERTSWRDLQKGIQLPRIEIPEMDPNTVMSKCKMLWQRLWI